MFGRLYCEFDRKGCAVWSVHCRSVTVFQPTAEQRQTEDDGVPCRSVIHMHTEWIKLVCFAVPGNGRVHFRAPTASCELWHASAKDTQHS